MECASVIAKKATLNSVQVLAILSLMLLVGVADARTPARVTTLAGGYVGDGKPAKSASLADPIGLVGDGKGNLYVSDSIHCRIRKINSNGLISTFAGTGICGYSGDGGPAASAMLNGPAGLATDR